MSSGIAPRICLSMIVRDEARVLGRCLQSVLPIIDAAVLCDTGSRDDTRAIAARLFEAAGTPARVIDRSWRHFGANRTEAIDEARTFVAALGWPLTSTYLLLVDADMELVVEPGFDRSLLEADGIDLEQRAGSLWYWNLRLARASRDWHAVGVTHEYYETSGPATRQPIDRLWILDHGDGGAKSDKIPRDIALLTRALAEAPGDPRSLFYLAQSYHAAGDWLRALVLYRQRVDARGWFEEAWYARLMVGRIYLTVGDLAEAERWLLDAATRDPRRAEPHFELARAYRNAGRHADAAAAAERGLAVGPPRDRRLFIHRDVYDHGLDEELAVAAWYTPDRARGLAACDRLILRRATPEDVRVQARQVMLWYVEPLAGARFRQLAPTAPPPYVACNPSIVRAADGHRLICRLVNYRQQAQWYASHDTDGVFRTRNLLTRLDRDGRLETIAEVAIVEPPPRHAYVQGLEDCRLFQHDGELWFTCTTADRHPSGRIHMSVCALDSTGRVRHQQPLMGPFDDRTQKNWLPFVDPSTGDVCAIYGYDPIVIVHIDVRTGQYDIVRETPNVFDGRAWRGSAGPVPWPPGPGAGWLAIVHEVTEATRLPGRPERVYEQRFVEFDASFAVRRVSHPFVFMHRGVEFPCGLSFGTDDSTVIVSLGVEDAKAYLCEVPVAAIERLLFTPDERLL